MNVFWVSTGFIIGYFGSKWLWGKKEGQEGKVPNLRIRIGSRTLALHHWMGFGLALPLFIFLKQDLLIGISIGGIIQGLSYKDWHKIWY